MFGDKNIGNYSFKTSTVSICEMDRLRISFQIAVFDVAVFTAFGLRGTLGMDEVVVPVGFSLVFPRPPEMGL